MTHHYIAVALMCSFATVVLAGHNHRHHPGNSNSSDDPPEVPSGDPSQNDQNVCISLKGDLTKGPILLIGVLDDSLIILTSGKSPTVYFIPVAQIGQDQFNLQGVAPQQLTEKWGSIAKSSDFQKQVISGKPLGSLLIQMDKATVMLFVTGGADGSSSGFSSVAAQVKPLGNVSLRSFPVESGITFDKTMWISSNEPGDFYHLYYSHDFQVVMLAKYEWDGSGNKAGFKEKSSLMMCTDNGTSVVFKVPPNSASGTCQFAYKWPWTRFRGFADGKNVYLFGPNAVFTFSMQAIAKPGTSTPLRMHQVDSFFYCPVSSTMENNIDDHDDITTQHSGGSIVTILIIVIVIIIIVVGVAGWFFFSKSKGTELPKADSSNIQAYMKASDADDKKNDEENGSNAGKSIAGEGSNVGGGESSVSSAKRPALKTKKKTGGRSSSTRSGPKGGSTKQLKKRKTSKASKRGKTSSVSKRTANSRAKSSNKSSAKRKK